MVLLGVKNRVNPVIYEMSGKGVSAVVKVSGKRVNSVVYVRVNGEGVNAIIIRG